jgi:hypothetical protein
MIAFPLISVTATAAAIVDHPHTYLASLTGLGLRHGESIESFSVSTRGVTFKAVCHIPYGWRITAGNSASPDGVLQGEGSQGITWLNDKASGELTNFVILTLYGPVQRRDMPLDKQGSLVPATFKGRAQVSTGDGERKVRLTYANIRLTSATGCPSSRP